MAVSFDDVRRLAKQHARSIAHKWRDVVIGEEDLEQEGLLIGWQALESYDLSVPDGMMFAYLHKRIVGRMRDVLRLSVGRAVSKSTIPLDSMSETDVSQTFDRYSHDETPEYLAQVAEGFLQAYGRLSKKQKIVMLMSMQGYSGGEVADNISVTPSRVSQVLHSKIYPKLLSAMRID